jgi:prevent-host-death family protein
MKAKRALKQRIWQLLTAKARFSEVFERARTEGPQRVTRRGKDAVVIVPAEDYERMTQPSQPKESLWEFFRKSPLVGLELDLERSRELPRDFKFEP